MVGRQAKEQSPWRVGIRAPSGQESGLHEEGSRKQPTERSGSEGMGVTAARQSGRYGVAGSHEGPWLVLWGQQTEPQGTSSVLRREQNMGKEPRGNRGLRAHP